MSHQLLLSLQLLLSCCCTRGKTCRWVQGRPFFLGEVEIANPQNPIIYLFEPIFRHRFVLHILLHTLLFLFGYCSANTYRRHIFLEIYSFQ